MSLAVFLKNNLTNIPPAIGKVINKFPYAYRPGIGAVYHQRKLEITQYELSSLEERKQFIFERMRTIVDFAYRNVPSYTEYYNAKNFHPDILTRFEDISKIPLTSKSFLNKYPIEERSFQKKGDILSTQEALRELPSASI